MNILEIKFTDGPNYWSIHRHRLLVMLLDLEELEQRPTDKISGFYKRITTLLPTLYEHRCSEGRPGGFFDRIRTGTWMGHVIEHIALELQTLAGMNTGFGRTRGAGREGLYHVVFACEDPAAGKYAALAAVRIAQALIDDQPYDLRPDIRQLCELARAARLGPSTAAIAAEAARRNIPVLRLNEDSLLQLGYGAAQRRIEAAVACTTSNIAVDLAADKAATKQRLREAAIPVPDGISVRSATDLRSAIHKLGYPLVIKPVDGNHGNGATMNIRDMDGAVEALRHAQKWSETCICERFISGADFRVLVVDYKFTAAALRSPASVTGDGQHTIADLVDRINADPRRGEGHDNLLTRIELDAATLSLLQQAGYSVDSILPAGKTVPLKTTANLSTGGTAEDMTDWVHPSNIALCERVARLIGLDICGIDLLAPNLSEPILENGGCIIEVNAGPGLRMHLQPSKGQPRNVAANIVDMLFPAPSTGRIPIIGITGTNGKTTTTRLIGHIGSQAGHKVGMTTTDGIYIDGHLISKGDCTGPWSSRVVLKDPLVDLAVLECARGGILRGGLGFDQCDIAVITNIAEDHLGMQGIDTIDQLARLKGVLAETVHPDGHAVLNADDPIVYALKERLNCHIALYSMDPDNPAIRTHVRQGGIAAIYENGFITVIENGKMIRIGQAQPIPITFAGMAKFNIANALAAALAGRIQGISAEKIYAGLTSFNPTIESIPGRMNFFNFGTFTILVDYAHNAHGLQIAGEFISSIPAASRIGVIAGVGDRRAEDIIGYASKAAQIFDEIIIRQDDDLRGRTADEINGLLQKGIRQIAPRMPVSVVPDELDAVQALLDRMTEGMLGVFFVDNIAGVLDHLKKAKASGKYDRQHFQTILSNAV